MHIDPYGSIAVGFSCGIAGTALFRTGVMCFPCQIAGVGPWLVLGCFHVNVNVNVNVPL